MDNNTFPSRKEILEKKYSSLVEQAKSIDLAKVDFSKSDYKPKTKVAEAQKVFIWIRLFIKNESDSFLPNDTITIRYTKSGEKLETKFICYGKSGLNTDVDSSGRRVITSYKSEDDKKVLCLMVDSERINKNSDDIPFIRTLFKSSRYFDYQLLKREDLQFIDKNGDSIEYFDVDF